MKSRPAGDHGGGAEGGNRDQAFRYRPTTPPPLLGLRKFDDVRLPASPNVAGRRSRGLISAHQMLASLPGSRKRPSQKQAVTEGALGVVGRTLAAWVGKSRSMEGDQSDRTFSANHRSPRPRITAVAVGGLGQGRRRAVCAFAGEMGRASLPVLALIRPRPLVECPLCARSGPLSVTFEAQSSCAA